MGNVTNNSKIITFYSFKGGVGRTMAIANTACYLANTHNLNLILVDWDLEAPGLHYYFGYSDHDLKDNNGLIDYIEDYKNAINSCNKDITPRLTNYLTPLSDKINKRIMNGSIRILTCGKTNVDYSLRVQEFDWKKFYREDYGFEIIENLKSELNALSDITIVDARAGQADIGTTSTIQVPDAVVMFFTSNRQSLEGTERVAKLIKAHPFRKSQGMSDLKIFLVPSRVFPEEDRFNNWLDEVAIPMHQRLLKNKILDPRDQPKGLRECILGIDPRFTFDEALPAIEDKLVSRLTDSYKDLAQAICDLHAGRDLWSTHKPDFITETEHNRESLLHLLGDAAKRGDEHMVTYINFELGRIAINERRYEEAESLLQAALASTIQKGEPLAISGILGTIALLRVNQGRPTEADSNLHEALDIARNSQNEALIAKLLFNLGVLKITQKNYDDGLKYFKDSIKIIKKSDNSSEFTNCLVSVADILSNNDRYRDAISILKSGLKYLTSNNELENKAKIEHKLADSFIMVNNFTEAFRRYESARHTFAHVGDADSQIEILDKSLKIINAIDSGVTSLTYLKKIASEKLSPKVKKRVKSFIAKLEK